jgi:hypothetical protein
MSNLQPDQVRYYGKSVVSLTKDELLKAVLELSEIIFHCPVLGKCKEVMEHAGQE